MKLNLSFSNLPEDYDKLIVCTLKKVVKVEEFQRKLNVGVNFYPTMVIVAQGDSKYSI